jgi:hypothetical protein
MTSKNFTNENFKNEVESVSTTKKRSKKNIIIIVIFVFLIIFTAFFYNKVRLLEKDPLKVNEEKIMKVVKKVEKLIDVPQSEIPTIAKITDLKPLEGNDFFKDAKVGNEVLFYPTSGKIYLYDPEVNIIINATTINTDTDQ